MSSKVLTTLLNDGDFVLEEYCRIVFAGDDVNVSKDYHHSETVVEIDSAAAGAIKEDFELVSNVNPGTYLILTQRSGSYYSDYDFDYAVKKVETYEVMQPVLKWKVIKEEE